MYEIIRKKFSSEKEPIDLIVVGLGFMGFGFISYLHTIQGIRVAVLISRRQEAAKRDLQKNGFKVKIVSNLIEIQGFVQKGFICITDNLSVIDNFSNELVVEMTGTIAYGAEIAIKTLSAKKHLVTMNPELQVTLGTELKKLADKNGVLITDVIGDQPGSLAKLIEKAKLMGFKILVAGNMKRYMRIHATQQEMASWARDKGLAVRQTTSFTDGTKQSIEMNLVSNFFGMGLAKSGMLGPIAKDVNDALKQFKNVQISKEGIVDFIIGKTLPPGVFLIVEHKDPRQKKYLRYLSLGKGPRYTLFEPYHLCHLEILSTIGKVLYFNQVTINNGNNPLTQTISLAKSNLKKGQALDGIGGDSVYGKIDYITKSKNKLPIGLTNGAILKRDIGRDHAIKFSDVILPQNAAVNLWLSSNDYGLHKR